MKDLEAAETVRGLLETMQSAIAAGDWKVDGACDPDMAIERAETFMRDQGYREKQATKYLPPNQKAHRP